MDKNRKSVKNMFLNCKGKHIKVYVYINRKLIKIFVILIKKNISFIFYKKKFQRISDIKSKSKKTCNHHTPCGFNFKQNFSKTYTFSVFFFQKKTYVPKNSFLSRLNPHPYNFLKVLYKKTILNAIISHIFFSTKLICKRKESQIL